MKYSNDIISRVVESSDIVDIVGENIRLNKRGRNFIGLCPFHQEKTPSFIVSPDKNIYKCFGCGKGGNSISFLMDYHSYTFNEALIQLANKYGIQLPKESNFDLEKEDRRDLLYLSLKEAANYYNKLLFTKDAKNILDYFISRNFEQNTIQKFQLGYASNSTNELAKHLKNKGFNDDIIVANGLTFKSDKGNLTDRFRNRAIFPIKDYIGRVVGFGARYLGEDKNQAKYINSPQNEIYDKSNILYGLFEAKNEIRHKNYAIITEGYADVITLSQNGIQNVVATSGTALTTKQLKLLKRFTHKIYISYDGDEAGIKATETAAELALTEGYDVLIIILPENEDPDSFVRKYQANSYYYHLNKAISYIEFIINRAKANNSLNSPFALSNLLKKLLEVISKIPDEIQHDFYIKDIANRLALSETQLKEAYKIKTQYRQKYLEQIENFHNDIELPNINYSNDEYDFDLDEITSEEQLLFKIVLRENNNLLHLFEYTDFSVDLLNSNTARELFEVITLNSESNDIINSIINNDYPQHIKDSIITLSIDQIQPSVNWTEKFKVPPIEYDNSKILNDIIRKMKLRKIKAQIKEIKKLIKEEPQNLNYLNQYNKLLKKENEISNKSNL